MVILREYKKLDGGEAYLRNACYYVTDERALAVGGSGVNYSDPDTAFHQMMSVVAAYGKQGYNPVYHFVVSYDASVVDENTACRYAKEIASYFDGRQQYLYCTHAKDRSSSGYHCHLVVNPCSYVDGRMLRDDFVEKNRFLDHIKAVTGRAVRWETD